MNIWLNYEGLGKQRKMLFSKSYIYLYINNALGCIYGTSSAVHI
jgi:hypothetical protein